MTALLTYLLPIFAATAEAVAWVGPSRARKRKNQEFADDESDEQTKQVRNAFCFFVQHEPQTPDFCAVCGESTILSLLFLV